MPGQTQYGVLDAIRKSRGAEKCKAAFSQLYQRNKAGALALVNDPRLTFPCLFVLWPLIDSFGLHRRLKPRHMLTLSLCRGFLNPAAGRVRPAPLPKEGDDAHKALRWMLETGYDEDGLSADFDRILDASAALLLLACRDRGALELTVALLFLRARRKGYTHNLVWALFSSRDTRALRLIAEKLRSSDALEASQARELLNLDELQLPAAPENPAAQQEAYLKWLDANDPYLYFTREGFQYSSKPVFSALDVERKYLQKANLEHTSSPIIPEDEHEAAVLAVFASLSAGQKEQLSAYSQLKKAENAAEWERWIRSPLAEQVAAMERGGEALV